MQETMLSVHDNLDMPATNCRRPCRPCRAAFARLSAVSSMTCLATNCIWSILRATLVSRLGSASKAFMPGNSQTIRRVSCGIIGSVLRASCLKRSSICGPASTIPLRRAARMGSSQSSPSILLTLSPHFGFSRRTDPLDSLYSEPLVLCVCASLRDHVPPTATKKARRRAANILLGIPAAPPVRSPHSLSALVNAMSGLNMKRWRNATRNSWNRVLEPVRNSNDSATFFSSIKS